MTTTCQSEHTCSNDIVDNDNPLPLLYRVLLYLEEIRTILLLICRLLCRPRQLSPLPHRHKAGSESQGQAWSEEEPSSFQPYHDIHLVLSPVAACHVQFQCSYEIPVYLRIGEKREDIFEEDARGREIRELA